MLLRPLAARGGIVVEGENRRASRDTAARHENCLRKWFGLKSCQVSHTILCKYHMKSPHVNTILPALYPAGVPRSDAISDFAERLAVLRKERGYTQQQLADRIAVHVQQLKRYEAGSSQPTLHVIRKLATALNVSADLLLFGKDQRGPDDDLRLQFEAISGFDADEKQVVRSLLEGMILKHEARRWSSVNGGASKAGRK